MIYMAGDNNLAVDMAYAMEQIKRVAAGADSQTFSSITTATPLPSPRCIVISLKRKSTVCSFLQGAQQTLQGSQEHNENAADPYSIINFVDWCVNKVEVENKKGEITYGRPAQKYALIFSGPHWVPGHPVCLRTSRQANR